MELVWTVLKFRILYVFFLFNCIRGTRFWVNYFMELQPVSYKRYFRCNNCFLILVYTIHLSLSTNLVDPPPMRTIYMKHPLAVTPVNVCMCTEEDDKLQCPVISYIDNNDNTKTTFLSPLIIKGKKIMLIIHFFCVFFHYSLFIPSVYIIVNE